MTAGSRPYCLTMAETGSARAEVAARFDQLAPVYDQGGVAWFGPIGVRLVELLDPQPGERALDVGAGRGAATFPLCHAVTARGRVTAADISTRMAELLRADAAEAGTGNLDVVVGDVAELGLGRAAYDVVSASLVLFFCPDPQAALRSWLSLVRPTTGRIGITTFGAQDEVWQRVDALFTPHLPPALLDARTAGRRGPFETTDALTALFERCGAVDVAAREEPVEVRLADAEAWRAWGMTLGQRAMWEAVPERERDPLLRDAAVILEQARREDRLIHLSQQVRYTTARVPAPTR